MENSFQQLPIFYVMIPGIFVFIMGVLVLTKRFVFLKKAQNVTGEVVSMAARYSGSLSDNEMPRYVPKVQFIAENGRQYEFVDSFASKVLSVRVGSKIDILYDPGDPRRAFINNIFTLWSRPVLILSLGVFLMFIFLE